MKPIKILFKILFLFALIIGAAIASIVFLVDPNDYKDDIVQQVKTKTGRDLAIPGDISFSVYPWLGLQLGKVSLSNPETFARPDFAQIESLNISLSLKQLLNFQPEVGVMHIDGLDITLIKRSDGVSNWDDLTSKGEPVPQGAEEPEERSDLAAVLKNLSISSFEIRNSSIKWLDETTKTNLSFNDFNLRTDPIQVAAPVIFDLSFITQLKEPAVSAKIITGGKLTTQSDFASITLNNWNLQADVSGDEIPGQRQKIQLSGNMIYDLSEQIANLIDIKMDIAGMSAILDVNISQLETAPITKGKLIVPEFSLAQTLQKLSIDMPDMADKKALSRVEILSDIDIAGNEVVLGNFIITVDGTEFTGDAKIETGDTINANYNFDFDTIDLDKYLPPVDVAANADSTASNKVDEPLDLPVELIRRLNLNGEFTAQAIKAFNVSMREITAKNVVRDDIAQVKLQVKKMYSGSSNVLLSVDARAKQPAVAAKGDLVNIKVGNFLKDYMDSDFVKGKGSVNFDIRSLAQTSGQLTSTLKGITSFNLLDGEISGINIAEKLRQAEALKEGVKYKKSREVNATDFANLSGKGRINNGRFTLSDFKLDAPLLRAKATGNVDIHNEKFDMRFDAYFVNTKTGQAGKQLSDVRSIRVPIKLKGTFDEPDLSLDGSRVLKEKKQEKINEAKNALDEKKQEVKDEAKQKLEEGVQEGLKNLFDKLR